MTEGIATLLEVGGADAGLSVVARPSARHIAPGDEPWFDVEIRVEASPFAGTLSTVLTLSDLQAWAGPMRSAVALPQRFVLGGGRASELVIDVERQTGGSGEALALQIEITPSGDDPYPFLRYLIFDASPFWAETADNVGALTRP